MINALQRYEDRLYPLRRIIGEENFVWYMAKWSIAWMKVTNDKPVPDNLGFWRTPADFYEEVCKEEDKTKHQMVAVINVLKSYMGDQYKYHWGITSEDIMHNARCSQIEAMGEQIHLMMADVDKLIRIRSEDLETKILAHTHGQPATPIELAPYLRAKVGNETGFIAPKYRLGGSNGQGTVLKLMGWDLATCALEFGKQALELDCTYDLPEIEYPQDHFGLLQVGPGNGDMWASGMTMALRLRGLARALWDHSSRGILVVQSDKGQSGSSAMPHKKNPIWFENAEGCFTNAYCILLNAFEANQDSRGLRDLSNSVINRHSLEGWTWLWLGIDSIIKGLERSAYSQPKVNYELDNNPSCLTELVRYYEMYENKKEDPYWELKNCPPHNFKATIEHKLKNWEVIGATKQNSKDIDRELTLV